MSVYSTYTSFLSSALIVIVFCLSWVFIDLVSELRLLKIDQPDLFIASLDLLLPHHQRKRGVGGHEPVPSLFLLP